MTNIPIQYFHCVVTLVSCEQYVLSLVIKLILQAIINITQIIIFLRLLED